MKRTCGRREALLAREEAKRSCSPGNASNAPNGDTAAVVRREAAVGAAPSGPVLAAGYAAAASSGAVAGATEQVRSIGRETHEAVVGVAKETPSFLSAAAGRSLEVSRELFPAARRLVERLRTTNDTHEAFKMAHPVG